MKIVHVYMLTMIFITTNIMHASQRPDDKFEKVERLEPSNNDTIHAVKKSTTKSSDEHHCLLEIVIHSNDLLDSRINEETFFNDVLQAMLELNDSDNLSDEK